MKDRDYATDLFLCEFVSILFLNSLTEVAARKIMPKHVVRHLMHKHSQELGGSNEVMNDEPMFSSGESDHLAGFEMDEALDEDDYHFQTKQINILAQSRKFPYVFYLTLFSSY